MLLELAWVPLAAAAAQWEVAQDPPGRKQLLNKSQVILFLWLQQAIGLQLMS